jgi:flagellar assembly protein FliH
MSSSSKEDGHKESMSTPMTDAKKFLFDTNNFDRTKPEVVVYSEEQVQLMKNQTLAQGKAEGTKETKQKQEELIGQLLQKALAHIEKMAKNEDRREVEKCADAVKLTMQVIGKLLPSFSQQYALSEIENVIAQSLEARRDEPRIAVIVPTQHLEALTSRIDALTAGKSYAGKVILIADDALAATDCRVEWADGGAERLYERLFSQIESEFTKAIAGTNMMLEQDKK